MSNETAIIPKIVILKSCIFYVTSIDSLVKSESYKRNSRFFLVQKVQDNFKTAFLKTIPNDSFQIHHKKLVIVSVCFDSFVMFFSMEIISMSWISVIHI